MKLVAKLDRPGYFKARVLDHSIDAKDGGVPFYKMQFGIIESQNAAGGWENIEQYQLQIIGYFYPIKKDNTVNTNTYNNLRECTGWNGAGLDTLHALDLSALILQIEVNAEEYLGKTTLKVGWIHPEDYEGGFKKLDAPKVKALAMQYGSILRASAGPVAAKPAAASAPRPTAPTARPPSAVKGCTADEAWSECLAAMQNIPNEKHGQVWTGLLAKLVPGKLDDAFTPADWLKVKDEGPMELLSIPF